jgi:2,3-bisphosphoglycerate-dependent phosphoglycerate mutase
VDPLTVILVRHAAPEPPIPGMRHADDNDRPLTGEGRRRASELVDVLDSTSIRGVYSSPYRRAIETVQPLAVARGLPIRVLEDLRERRLAAVPLEHGAFVDAVHRTRADPTYSLPGGETTADVIDRARRALNRILEETGSGIAVAGTHGGLISIIRWSLGEILTVEDALNMSMPGLLRLQWHPEGWRIM